MIEASTHSFKSDTYSATYTGPDGYDSTQTWVGYSDVDVITEMAKMASKNEESITIVKNGVPMFRVTSTGKVQTRPTNDERRCITETMTRKEGLVSCKQPGIWYHKRYSGPVCETHKRLYESILNDGWSHDPISPEHHIETVEEHTM